MLIALINPRTSPSASVPSRRATNLLSSNCANSHNCSAPIALAPDTEGLTVTIWTGARAQTDRRKAA